MIKAQQLTRRFGNLVAVDRVDLEVPRGCVTGFLGPNGAGKTTTMRMLCGVLTPNGGSACIDGVDVVQHPERTRVKVGYLPESAPVYPEMRVVEYLRFRAGLYGVSSRHRAIDRVLSQCDLTGVRRRIIGQLSKGFRQRVALAAALLHDPPVLILDEPTAGLDPTQIDSIRRLIRTLASDRAILLSTHILSEVEAICDAIVMVVGGRVLRQGSLESVCGGMVCRVETDLAGAAKVLAAVPGVDRVTPLQSDPPWQTFELSGAGDVRLEVIEAVQRSKGRIREIHAHRRALEDVFRTALSETRAAQEGPTCGAC
jgi:ABC-2 type transport system ATP-binding protein